MILEISYKSGEQGVNHREFTLKAYHMDPTPDSIAPLLIHLNDLLLNMDGADLLQVIPRHVPEIAQAEYRERRNDGEAIRRRL